MRQRRLFDCLINLPTGILAASCLVFALGLVLVLSLRTNDGRLIAASFTLENYRSAATDALFGFILAKSFLIAAFVSLATVALAYPVAYYIAFHAGEHRAVWLILVTLPFWTSYLLRIFAWKIILGYNGIMNSAFVSLGVPGAPFETLLYNPTAMVMTLAHAYAAFAILPIYVSLSAIEPRLLEAAMDLGARPSTVFGCVVLPLSLPGVGAAVALVFIPTLGDYATPVLVGGPSSTMIGNLIQAQFSKADNWPLGAAMATLTMVTLCALYGGGRLGARLWQWRQA